MEFGKKRLGNWIVTKYNKNGVPFIKISPVSGEFGWEYSSLDEMFPFIEAAIDDESSHNGFHTCIGIMGMFIPSKAPNADAAHKFIEFILDPERGAKCYEYLGYYCTASASEPYISEEYRPFLTLPAEFTADRMEMIGNITPEADAAHLEAWTSFREKCE